MLLAQSLKVIHIPETKSKYNFFFMASRGKKKGCYRLRGPKAGCNLAGHGLYCRMLYYMWKLTAMQGTN